MVDLRVRIGDIAMQNPIMPGSGTFAEGMAQVFDLNRLGAIVCKSITPDIREGVPPPRIAEFRDATLFSVGIPSKGPDYFCNHTVPFYSRFAPPLIASVSADSIDGFATLAERISVPGVAAIEADISCPNLRKDGMAFGMDVKATEQIFRAMKQATRLPIWAKLTPNAGDIAATARAAERGGADALTVANALLAMAIDPDTFLPRVANIMGGITGPATKPIILRMAYQCAKAVGIPIIGCGGISTARDVVEYMLAGATAVQIGTASILSASSMIRVIDELVEFCDQRGITRVTELIGAMRHHPPMPFQPASRSPELTLTDVSG
jgi:dihydroorotate dehydrogenase (NAD+) catalytic subunit